MAGETGEKQQRLDVDNIGCRTSEDRLSYGSSYGRIYLFDLPES